MYYDYKISYSVRCGSRCNDQPEGDSAYNSAYWHERWALAADKTMEAESLVKSVTWEQ